MSSKTKEADYVTFSFFGVWQLFNSKGNVNPEQFYQFGVWKSKTKEKWNFWKLVILRKMDDLTFKRIQIDRSSKDQVFVKHYRIISQAYGGLSLEGKRF